VTAKFTALFDANVLYRAVVRDLVLQLALYDLYRARWSARIHEEWIRSLLKNRPDLSRNDLQRTRDLMDASVPDCLVTGYEHLVDRIRLPDPTDRHVVAAAVIGRADVIVTYNITDFPDNVMKPFKIEVQHPDEFLTHLTDLDQNSFGSAVKTIRRRLKNPPLTVEQYLDGLRGSDLVRTAAELEKIKSLL